VDEKQTALIRQALVIARLMISPENQPPQYSPTEALDELEQIRVELKVER